MLKPIAKVRERALAFAKRAQPIGPTLARITVGVVFAASGWAKLHNLDGVTQFFTQLGLPAPHFQATLVATTEFLGGALVLVGLLTRLAVMPLAVTMVVAIATAKRADIDSVRALLGLEEWSYLVFFVWLMVAGPGPLSLDKLLDRYFKAREVE
jgi:putative oxidoreductase